MFSILNRLDIKIPIKLFILDYKKANRGSVNSGTRLQRVPTCLKRQNKAFTMRLYNQNYYKDSTLTLQKTLLSSS
jgi:hypothetical protein